MERISIVEEWKAKARREAQLEVGRTNLMLVLRSRFRAEVPADLKEAIEQETDPNVLWCWFRAALVQPSLEAFRSVVQGDGTAGARASH